MSDELLKQTKRIAYEEGIVSALNELREVYGEGIEETNLWNEYMTKENN
jgi:hypothetical protein